MSNDSKEYIEGEIIDTTPETNNETNETDNNVEDSSKGDKEKDENVIEDEKEDIFDDKVSFLKLTPWDDVELEIYEKALDYAFSESDIKNIAISGPYGSGKSSVIETYSAMQKDKKRFIYISLAHFEKPHGEMDEATAKNLEGKIINQLMHQINPKSIPQTLFKTKEDVKRRDLIKFTFWVITLIILLLINIYYPNWLDLVDKLEIPFVSKFLAGKLFQSLTFIGILAIIAKGIYHVSKIQTNTHFIKKASAKSVEVEVLDSEDATYFDKYLNEVLYLLRNSNADAIVFEDIDRYDDNFIFEKLREINTLVNNKFISINNNQTDNCKTIKFLYLIKDDIFISKDRTKFFDFIIPIIPTVDGSNALDTFITHFKQHDILDLFDEMFLSEISLYVDEYRMLKNIVNEFVVYYSKLHTINLDSNKLLAMIVYKNMFPKDFSLLQLNKGYIMHIFNKKYEYKRSLIDKLKSKLKLIDEQLLMVQNELYNSIDELDAAYLVLPNYLRINNNPTEKYESTTEIIKAMKDKNNEITINEPYTSYPYSTIQYKSIDYNMEDALSLLHENDEYEKRYKILKDGKNIVEDRLLDEKYELNIEIDRVDSMMLRELITRENKDVIFGKEINELDLENAKKTDEFAYIKGNNYFDLIKYLLTSGYLDEDTYFDYMSYFYPKSITQRDKIFLRGLTDQRKHEYNYNLDSPTKIANRLGVYDFRKIEILNFDLLSYLLINEEDYEPELKELFELISNNYFLFAKGFVINYFKEGKNIDVFTTQLFLHVKDFKKKSILDAVIDDSEISNDDKFRIILYSLFYNEIKVSDKTRSFISEYDDFVEIKKIEVKRENFTSTEIGVADARKEVIIDNYDSDKVVKILINNEIKLSNLKFSSKNREILKRVYENNRYIITLNNIKGMLEYFYDGHVLYLSKLYSIIASEKGQPLYKYIRKEPQEFIQQYLRINQPYADMEENALEIINDKRISMDSRTQYLSRLNTPIKELKSIIDMDMWDICLENNAVNNNENNVLDFFFERGSNQNVLISFMNRRKYEYKFDIDNLDESYGEESKVKLFTAITEMFTLNDYHYSSILESIGLEWKKFDINSVPKSKMEILFASKKIKMNKDNLLYIRENYNQTINEDFICSLAKEYTELIDEECFDYDEMIFTLSNDGFNDVERIKLMMITEETINFSSKYSNIVKKYIIKNNFNYNDFDKINQSYEMESEDVRMEFVNKINTDIDSVIDNEYALTVDYLKRVIMAAEVSEEGLLQLILNSLDNLNYDNAKEIFILLGISSFNKIFVGRQALIKKNEINEKLLNEFKNRGWISKYSTDRLKSTYYRTYYKRVKKEIKI